MVTFTADLGQGEEVEPARAKASRWACREDQIYIEDLREEFVRDFVFPMFRANTDLRGRVPARHLDRPTAHRQAPGRDRRTSTGADAISHGATGKGNDQVRFELGAYALDARHQGHRPVARVGSRLAASR